MAGQLENYKEKLIRSEDFINELKADIYLHSLGHIMEPEEKEKINQKLQ